MNHTTDVTKWIPAQSLQTDEHKIVWRQRSTPPIQQIGNTSWLEYISNTTEWESHLLSHSELLRDMAYIKSILQNHSNTITCVSDGGVDNELGSYGWVIAHNDEILLQGKGHVPGSPMSSQRAECCGKLSWLTWIIHAQIYHDFEVGCCIESYCDNKSVVTKSKRSNDYANPSYTITPNYDMFKTIFDQQQRISEHRLIDTKWVKGHQDIRPNEQLPLEARLNIKADALATEAKQDILDNIIPATEYMFPAGQVSLICDNKIVSSQEHHILRWRFSEFELHEYYARLFNVKTSQLHQVNWAGLRIARNKLSPSEQTFSIKQMINWLPTGHKLQQYGKEITNCPLCDHPFEDGDHLWTCTTRLDRNKQTIISFECT